jgi:hypothetical protein
MTRLLLAVSLSDSFLRGADDMTWFLVGRASKKLFVAGILVRLVALRER